MTTKNARIQQNRQSNPHMNTFSYSAASNYVRIGEMMYRRWDSERELFLRRHRARTTKYNRLVHKFRSTRLCVGTHVFTKFSEITQYNGHYVVQGHSRSPIGTNRKLIYDFLLVINTNLPPILHRFLVMADYSSNFR